MPDGSLSILWRETRNTESLVEAWAAIQAGTAWSGEIVCNSKDNSSYTADASITPIVNDDGTVEYMVGIARNVAERKFYESRLDYQANHDALTELPNRLFFSKKLAAVLSERGRDKGECAVFFIDIDRFKLVNDTMGHDAGDSLLVEVAARLGSCLRQGDVLARMGGDEFAVLVSDLKSPGDARQLADRMLETISQPFSIGHSRMVASSSIGISIYPHNATDVDELLRTADAAMYKAKESVSHCEFYSVELSHANFARVTIERDLRRAIAGNELRVDYQPIIDVDTERLVGAEALIRWRLTGNGMVPPAIFVPVAEETGLILEIGEAVLESACNAARNWIDIGLGEMEISVNVSPFQLRSWNFVPQVLRTLQASGLPAHLLKLEITETALAKNDYGEVNSLTKLRDAGVQICIDDFGIGYSTLSRLKDFPIAHVKVDGSFIRDIECNEKNRAMAGSIITLAHNLGMGVTAEWIENEEQMEIIRSLKCDLAQGHLMSPALPAEAFEEFARSWLRESADKKAA
jgi:diguanylate cyclase (GGDEF)-like protein